MALDGSPQDEQLSLVTPEALAAELEALEARLKEGLRETSDPALKAILEKYPEALQRVHGALGRMAKLFEPFHAAGLAQREREFGFIVSRFGQGIQDLSKSNEQVSHQVRDHGKQLDRLADAEPTADTIAQVRAIAKSMQETATRMAASLEAMAVHLDSTAERLATLGKDYAKAQRPDLYDEITRLPTRAALDERLEVALLTGGVWSLLLADIDKLTEINEQFGEIVGDALLFKVARIIERRAREKVPDALVTRFDGGKFAIFAALDLQRATALAEHVRIGVASSKWQYRGEPEQAVLATTIRVGVTTYKHGDTAETILARLAEATSEAKERGGNRVVAKED